MNQTTILTAPSGALTRIDNVAIDGIPTTLIGYFTDAIEINADGSYGRQMVGVTFVNHPNYQGDGIWETFVTVPADNSDGQAAELSRLFGAGKDAA